MRLLIHDLNDEEWNRIEDDYKGWEIISDNGSIKPCVGCFGCWTKTPGVCMIKDSYDRMGVLFHKADEVVVMSRYTYGGFSSFVKNVFDRSIGLVLPYMKVFNGEMHHEKRYPEKQEITFIFRGKALTDTQKEHAKKYVEAVCRNFHGDIKALKFENIEESDNTFSDNAAESKENTSSLETVSESQKILLINCSSRGDDANSLKFLKYLSGSIECETESINLLTYLNKYNELAELVTSYKRIVFGMPLYVDGIPSTVLRLLEKLEAKGNKDKKKIYVVANMGFYESRQICNLLGMMEEWAETCGYEYCGGVAIGAGEMMGQMMRMPDPTKGPARNVALSLKELGQAVNEGTSIENIYADAYKFPRILYQIAGNSGWPRSAKRNGLKKKDMLKRW
ncbi:flavodoxin family protein [Butyrivibrio sp. INlla16]|uniref:flavodoxin family protein n=1 Tax=Butyrivibrio sp. INlla16 TaxID=1520807 RepID=UPI00088EE775|nr:flavodoxin family protein [Butyrivibrio sp. INlla16]SDB58262.1 hypothetical protein SAMN02910263_02996 [Butyrivibrio sp. INlla16]